MAETADQKNIETFIIAVSPCATRHTGPRVGRVSPSDPVSFPEPRHDTADPRVLFASYLDFYRRTAERKVAALPPEFLRTSSLPSGWTPLELLSHLAHMERRWFVWGFLGEQVPEPWGEVRDGRWHVAPGVGLPDVLDLLHGVAARTTALLAEHEQDQPAVPGPRFDGEPPTLASICFHVLQEYARHVGQLDVAVELVGGVLGE